MNPRSHSRRRALRHLMHPHQVRESMSIAKQPSLRNSILAGVQAGITIAAALPLVWLSPWSHLIGFASLGTLVALFGRFAPPRDRNRILFLCLICQVAAVLVMSTVAWLGAPFAIQLCLLALACGLFMFISLTFKFGAPGPLIFVFAASASMSTHLTLPQVAERTAMTAAVAALALAICAATEGLRHHATPDRPLPVEPTLPVSDRLQLAVRASVGAAIAALASYLFGADHPGWAAMGALAVLQGTHLHINMNRALQRSVGTGAGAILAWALLNQDPSVSLLIIVLIGLQVLTEIVIGFNYALGQVLVTPMALLMTHLAAPQAGGPQMAPERVLDTLLGAAMGVGIAILLSTIDDRRQLTERRAKGRQA